MRDCIAAFTLDVFKPSVIFSSAQGLAIMYAFLSFIGFEAAALYGREAKDPNKSVPRAMVISVTLMALFFIISTWLVTGPVGSDAVAARAFEGAGGSIILDLANTYGGSALFHATSLLLLTAILSTYLGMINFASRYLYNLAVAKMMPS